LAESEQVPLETFEKLVALAKEGANVIFHKKLPTDVPGLGYLDARRNKFKSLLAELSFVKNTAGFSRAKIGQGSFLVGENLDEMMIFAQIYRETMIDNGLQFVRKTHAKGNYYFVNNKTTQAFDGWVKLSVNAQSAALYNPMTETLGMAKYKAKTNEIYLQLAAGESCIIETYKTPVSGANYAYYKTKGEIQELTGTWKISFLEGGPELPKTVETKSLGSWTKLEGDAYKYFSGTASYSIDFTSGLT
jgi:hypothetical protein